MEDFRQWCQHTLNPVLSALEVVEQAASKVRARHRQYLVHLGTDAAPLAEQRWKFGIHADGLAGELDALAHAVEAARQALMQAREKAAA